MKHVLLAVSGPSGVGKGTMVKTIIARRSDVVESVSCTTRPPREGEVHGKHYFFLAREEFERRIQEDDFLEYDEHFGNYYGTPKSFVRETLKTKSVIMEIDVVGALNAKKSFPNVSSLWLFRRRWTNSNAAFRAEARRRKSKFKADLPVWNTSCRTKTSTIISS